MSYLTRLYAFLPRGALTLAETHFVQIQKFRVSGSRRPFTSYPAGQAKCSQGSILQGSEDASYRADDLHSGKGHVKLMASKKKKKKKIYFTSGISNLTIGQLKKYFKTSLPSQTVLHGFWR